MQNFPSTIELPACGSWPATKHLFETRTQYAIQAAINAQRPLLIRGEPGCGKSQLARAAAVWLKRVFVCEVVHARCESQDLQWHYDAVARLGDAQTLGTRQHGDVGNQLAQHKYLSPGVLWWVFDWNSAQAQYEKCEHNRRRESPPEGWKPEQGSVLLIDEIDKADIDLPNGLLETLGNGAFTAPYQDEPIGLSADIPHPLIVITTNEERELPGAFVRRCMVLHIRLPQQDSELIDWLMARGRLHFGEQCGEAVMEKAASLLCTDRLEAKQQGLTPPGQAEYLDMLRAVSQVDQSEQTQLLDKISEFALKKFTGMTAW